MCARGACAFEDGKSEERDHGDDRRKSQTLSITSILGGEAFAKLEFETESWLGTSQNCDKTREIGVAHTQKQRNKWNAEPS